MILPHLIKLGSEILAVFAFELGVFLVVFLLSDLGILPGFFLDCFILFHLVFVSLQPFFFMQNHRVDLSFVGLRLKLIQAVLGQVHRHFRKGL